MRRAPGRAARGGRDDRGSAAGELVVLTFVAFAFVSILVFAGRVNVGAAHTEAAARAAARTISLARDPASAEDRAREQASRIVDEGTALCTDMRFSAQIGPEEVTVTVGCTIDLSEAALVELPGTKDVESEVTESIDQFREGT